MKTEMFYPGNGNVTRLHNTLPADIRKTEMSSMSKESLKNYLCGNFEYNGNEFLSITYS